MTESPAPTSWPRGLENRLRADSTRDTGFVLLLAFLLRLWKASGTFLNPDEAMHFLVANKPSLAEAYRASLSLAHPPLLILLLHVWGMLGKSELFLRLPLIIAGTIFCWIFFRWLTRLLGCEAGWFGFILVSLLPAFVELSSEVRQYSLLLCFMIAAAYFLELALDENSAAKMTLFFFFLSLALLTHFSAILFAGAIGAYSLWRLLSRGSPGRVFTIWVAGQTGAFSLLGFLYVTQISKLRADASAEHMQVLLTNSYFHPGHDRVLGFIFARTFGVLQYTFGQLAVGDIAGLLFVAGVVLLIAKDSGYGRRPRGPSSRQLALLLILPFVINCAAAMADLYPYGGTRHSAFLAPFAIAGVSVAITRLTRGRVRLALAVAVLIVAVCQVFGTPHRPYMRREDQRRTNMTQALDAIRHTVAADDVIFVDFQTNFLLRYHLCPEAIPEDLPASDFRTYSCAGYRVISTNSETNVLTADSFLRCRNELINANALRAGQTIWIFQAGWDIALAQQLQQRIPEYHNLKVESFGRNISLFKLTTG